MQIEFHTCETTRNPGLKSSIFLEESKALTIDSKISCDYISSMVGSQCNSFRENSLSTFERWSQEPGCIPCELHAENISRASARHILELWVCTSTLDGSHISTPPTQHVSAVTSGACWLVIVIPNKVIVCISSIVAKKTNVNIWRMELYNQKSFIQIHGVWLSLMSSCKFYLVYPALFPLTDEKEEHDHHLSKQLTQLKSITN